MKRFRPSLVSTSCHISTAWEIRFLTTVELAPRIDCLFEGRSYG